MKSSAKKIELASVDDLFSTEESRADAQREKVVEIPLSELHPFKGHPFKVKDDEAMMETADSIKQYGVLVPAIARPDPEGGYELVAGHRRHRASELAEKETGVEAGRAVLQTAGKAVKLKVEADRNELPADGESLTFVKIRLEDAAGNFNRRESAAVTIKVEGCAALQGFGSADPSCEGSYQSHTWNTYDGSVMAVIRAAKCPGEAIVTISAVNFAEEKLVLNIK